MRIDPTLPVIAVFGSNPRGKQPKTAAAWLGRAVNQAGAVVLTGGTGPEDTGIKGAAIAGAEGSGDPTWIGVARSDVPTAPVDQGPHAVVLTPGWGHRRNFVEACLCDAAIALGATTPGTASEALFCLYLGRPVVVLGDEPAGMFPLRQLLELAQSVIQPPETVEFAVDRGIDAAYRWAKRSRMSIKVTPWPKDADGAQVVVDDLILDTERPSAQVSVGALATASQWDEYVGACLPVDK